MTWTACHSGRRASTPLKPERCPTKRSHMSDHRGNKDGCLFGAARRLSSTLCRGPTLACWSLALMLLTGFAAWSDGRVPADPRIARLNHAGFTSRGHCTGFATQAGTLVTAAHCLPSIQSDTVHALFAYETGYYARHSTTSGGSYRHLEGRDIAALCDPLRHTVGFQLAEQSPKPGTKVRVQGYGIPKAHVLQMTTCRVLSMESFGRFRLDCPLPPGTSGAPVMLLGSQDVVGVVSTSAASHSYATSLSGMEHRICN